MRNSDMQIERNERNKVLPSDQFDSKGVQALNAALKMGESTVVFIDGANFHNTCRELGLTFDFAKFRSFLDEQTQLVRIYYYTSLLPEDQADPIRTLVKWLGHNGYEPVTRVRQQYHNLNGEVRFKTNMDMEMAVDMMSLPIDMPRVTHVILMTADGDFAYPVEKLKQKGLKVTCISPSREVSKVTSTRLISTVDLFVPLEDVTKLFTRETAVRDDKFQQLKAHFNSGHKKYASA